MNNARVIYQLDMTTAYLAAKNGKSAPLQPWNDMVRLLVDNGADLSIKNIDGYTPRQTALGNIRGLGREASIKVIHEDTAKLLESLENSTRDNL